MTTLVVFRGRNTAAIAADANRYLSDINHTITICRDGDALKEEGDITVAEFIRRVEKIGSMLVVANGGTTAQCVPVVAHLAAAAAKSQRNWSAQVVDLQRDAVSVLWESTHALTMDKTVLFAGPLVGHQAVEHRAAKWSNDDPHIEEVKPRMWIVSDSTGLLGVITK